MFTRRSVFATVAAFAVPLLAKIWPSKSDTRVINLNQEVVDGAPCSIEVDETYSTVKQQHMADVLVLLGYFEKKHKELLAYGIEIPFSFPVTMDGVTYVRVPWDLGTYQLVALPEACQDARAQVAYFERKQREHTA